MATGAVVRLAGITFNDGEDGDGDLFVVSDLAGWDGAGVELAKVEKPLGAGSIIVFGRLTTWTLTLSGWVVAGPDGIGPARRKLATALYGLVDTAGTLEVDEDDATYSLSVRLDSDLRTRQQGPSAISFEAILVAATPTKAVVGS
jgi:hypothetical protein